MNRDDIVIEIIVINKRPEKSYKKNSKNVTWTKEEEQIKYYKYKTRTRKRMTWKKIGLKVNKSPALVKKIWHSIIEDDKWKVIH